MLTLSSVRSSPSRLLLIALVATAGASALSGCVVAPARYHAHAAVVYDDPSQMPPPEVEVMGVAPSPAHVWVAGKWHWGGRAWVWGRGHWALR